MSLPQIDIEYCRKVIFDRHSFKVLMLMEEKIATIVEITL